MEFNYFFVKTLKHCNIRPEAWSLKNIVWDVSIVVSSFIVLHWAKSELYGPKKVIFHLTKTWYYLEYVLNS